MYILPKLARPTSVITILHLLGAARWEVQDTIAQGGVHTLGPELNDVLGGYYGVKY
jgi:hypothetical protein